MHDVNCLTLTGRLYGVSNETQFVRIVPLSEFLSEVETGTSDEPSFDANAESLDSHQGSQGVFGVIVGPWCP